VTQTIALIDYGSGNLRSAAKALERAAADQGLSASVELTSDPDKLRLADRIVLPGVGAFGQCAGALRAINGMEHALEWCVTALGKPFLGVCVGMQLMAQRSYEYGLHLGLGWIDGDVLKIQPRDHRLKVPHMGWNRVSIQPAGQDHPVLRDLDADGQAYFVHSFHLQPSDARQVLATTSYGETMTAVVGRDTMIGVQFHPEKSQAYGLQLLANFLTWKP
jgi:imidazole glycerol-phosphate synthase subunit HisH